MTMSQAMPMSLCPGRRRDQRHKRVTKSVVAGERQIAFYGDSFVEGIGDPVGVGVGGGGAAALGSFDALNFGARGETSVEVAARWRASGRSLPLVLSVGANDSCDSGIEGEARVALAESVSVVGGVLSECSALLLPVFCVGPGPVG